MYSLFPSQGFRQRHHPNQEAHLKGFRALVQCSLDLKSRPNMWSLCVATTGYVQFHGSAAPNFRAVCWKTIHHRPVDLCHILTDIGFHHPHVRFVHAGTLHQLKELFPCLLKSLNGNNSAGPKPAGFGTAAILPMPSSTAWPLRLAWSPPCSRPQRPQTGTRTLVVAVVVL